MPTAPSSPSATALDAVTLHTARAALASMLASCDAGLVDEIAVVQATTRKWGGDRPVTIRRGSAEDAVAGAWSYACQVDRWVNPPLFTAVQVTNGRTTRKGYVDSVSPDGRTLVLVTEEPLEFDGVGAQVAFHATELLEKQREQLKRISPESVDSELLMRVLGLLPARSAEGPRARVEGATERHHLNTGQAAALSRAIASDCTLTLGPPGTGKTTMAAATIEELLRDPAERILVVAHTNAALDVFLRAIVRAVPPAHRPKGTIVRVGRVSQAARGLGIGQAELLRDGFGKARPFAGGALGAQGPIAERHATIDEIEQGLGELLTHPALRGTRFRVQRLGGSRATPEERVARLKVRLSDALASGHVDAATVATAAEQLERALRSTTPPRTGPQTVNGDALTQLVGQARIVGATTSMLAQSPGLFDGFTTVAPDELSMIGLPALILAARLAETRLVAFGDPLQIRPIAQSHGPQARATVGRDLYTHLGLDDPSVEDARRPMLTEQYRMPSPVCGLVSAEFYNGRLTDAPAIAERAPSPVPPLLVVDTSDTDAQSIQEDTSRSNARHAMVIRELVSTLQQNGTTDITVVTPFKAQRERLKRALELQAPGPRLRYAVKVLTAYQAQGAEYAAVIVDLVDAGAMSSFLDERKPIGAETAHQLCVVCSRPTQMLALVAHTRTFRLPSAPPNGRVLRILKRATRLGVYTRCEPGGSLPRAFLDSLDDQAALDFGGDIPASRPTAAAQDAVLPGLPLLVAAPHGLPVPAAHDTAPLVVPPPVEAGTHESRDRTLRDRSVRRR